jgi:acetyl esterase/lipase
VLTRRVLLGVGLTSAGVLAAGCADDGEETAVGVERRTYGDDPSQWADLHRPEGGSRGVVVVIHGGFWKAAYDASLGTPLAEDLAARGWTAWNVEYRRVGENGGGDGGGGGVPATLDDVADAIDALADVPGLDLSTVVTLGHSAGGHLATWAAGRERYPRWAGAGAGAVPVTAVVSQAGVLDLVAAADAGLGAGAVEAFVGGAPSAYDLADPMRQVPLAVPVWCVHGTSDTEVPLSQSADYVAAARAAGATAELVEVEGDHYVVIDPTSDAWTRTLTILDGLG